MRNRSSHQMEMRNEVTNSILFDKALPYCQLKSVTKPLILAKEQCGKGIFAGTQVALQKCAFQVNWKLDDEGLMKIFNHPNR